MTARFFAEIQGQAGGATRIGNTVSGIWAHIRGWHLGVNVRMFVNEDGNDELTLHITGGSKNPNEMKLIYRDEHGNEQVFDTGSEFRFVVPKKPKINLDTEN